MADVQAILSKLKKVKGAGHGKWSALCPGHADKKPSLSVGLGEDGKVLLHCHAGCDVKTIVAAIGMTETDLFADAPAQPGKPEVVATYDYTDLDGNLLYQVVRRSDKSFLQRRPDGRGGWVWNIKGTPRVLYNLPYVASTPIEDWVFIVEGEKDVDNLREFNIAATTNSGGAGKWHQVADDSVLHGRQVAIIPDNDEPGREHAQQVATALHGKAKIVKIIKLPRMPEKGDVSDWLARFNEPNGATPYIRIRRYAHKAKEFVPAGLTLCEAEPKTDKAQVFGPVLTCLADVQPCDVEWLWPRRIAIGKITMLAGDPGLGKSFCSMDVAARVSAGLAWPDLPDQPQEPGDVIILSAEDALDDTIRPRLDAAQADPSKVCALQAIREIDPNTGKPRQRGFHLDKDIDNLEHALKQRPGCRLVVIDPISSYMGDANSHNNAEVRGLLAPLSDLAARHRVAILCISHLNKGAGDAMYRVMGSLAFVAAARAGYAVVKDCKDDTGQRRLILPIKNNLGDDETGLAYRIMETAGNDQPHVEWEPEVVYTTVNEALGIDRTEDDVSESAEDKERRQSQVAEAVDWLTSYLNDGEKPAKEVITAAKADGIAQRTLDRAKPRAGVVARREGFADGGRWMWRLIELEALVEQAKAATEG
jgi:5S rRNA maturation endonuclease (ribonuclease M5)